VKGQEKSCQENVNNFINSFKLMFPSDEPDTSLGRTILYEQAGYSPDHTIPGFQRAVCRIRLGLGFSREHRLGLKTKFQPGQNRGLGHCGTRKPDLG